jgi:hypothetical protein
MTQDFLREAALSWYDAGCSVWPPAQDGTKRPMGEWKQFMRSPAPRELIDGFYRQGLHEGVGIICGKVSGNLEMLELEGRATTSDALDDIREQAQARGVLGLLDQLLEDGYAEWTPSGGVHLLYRVTGQPVPGNTKIARRPATPEELLDNPDAKVKTLAETRGEGGYVIVAPSGGSVHPSGDSWSTFAGAIGKIPTVTWANRCELVEAIKAALDSMPNEPEFIRPPAPRTLQTGMNLTRPGDDFAARTSWEEILEPHGWRVHHRTTTEIFWTRPGKKRIEGWSASTGFSGSGLDDRLYVWSSSTEFDTEKPYNKFGAYTLLEHGGDFASAARELGSRGYGTARTPMVAASPVPTAPASPVPAVVEAPTPQRPMDQAAPTQEVTRNMLVANDDRWFVWQNLTKELVSRWDRDRLFNYGNVICERDGLTMRPATKDVLDGITAETCQVVNLKTNAKGQESYVKALIESRILGMIMAFPKEFSKLDKLSQIPFLRPDGTICSTPGYDEPTHSFLELDPELQGIDIPEAPTREQVASARSLLLDDLLGDFPLHTEADKANALATLITPFVRDLIPTSPLAVIDAKEAGSGKNLLADVISILTTGKAAQTLPYTTEAEEQRKVITSAFRSGSAMLLFDEAHVIEGAAFARALTSHSYQDRVLGASDLAEFPNNRTWVSLGNQVQIKGDMGRRVYRVRLEYPGARPESREASDFKHPDLRQWTMDNRRELVRACLTLVRAWFALGKPVAPLPFRMGSFEKWQEILAGVLWVAGVEGFLVNVPQWRSESDFERQDQVAHLWWLETQFGSGEFTSAGVTDALRRDRQAPHPHNMDDPFQEGYARKLGQMYAKLKDRILDGYQLVKLDGKAHDKVIKWKIRKIEEDVEGPPDVASKDGT